MASFWDELKDLFKTKSQKEEERQQKIKEALDSEGELAGKLDALDKAYKDYEQSLIEEPDWEKLFPSESGLEEIEYTAKSDEELEREATVANEYDKTAEKNKIESGYESNSAALGETKDRAEKTLGESYENLRALYEELKEKTENDALKRGLARSSIASSQLGALDGERLKAAGQAEAAYNQTVNAVNRELELLEADRERALGELDLKYAAELDNKISKLKSERDKTVKEYEKYNNDVRKKQAQFDADREHDIQKYIKNAEKERLEKEAQQREYEAKYGYSGAKAQNYAKRYELAYDFYMALSPDIAAAALEASPNMRYYLGNNYYKLLNALNSRGENTKIYY